jgi:hypothetical protein
MQSHFLRNSELFFYILGALDFILLLPRAILSISVKFFDYLIHKLRKVDPFYYLACFIFLVVIDEIFRCFVSEEGVETNGLKGDDDERETEDEVPKGFSGIILVH